MELNKKKQKERLVPAGWQEDKADLYADTNGKIVSAKEKARQELEVYRSSVKMREKCVGGDMFFNMITVFLPASPAR